MLTKSLISGNEIRTSSHSFIMSTTLDRQICHCWTWPASFTEPSYQASAWWLWKQNKGVREFQNLMPLGLEKLMFPIRMGLSRAWTLTQPGWALSLWTLFGQYFFSLGFHSWPVLWHMHTFFTCGHTFSDSYPGLGIILTSLSWGFWPIISDFVTYFQVLCVCVLLSYISWL